MRRSKVLRGNVYGPCLQKLRVRVHLNLYCAHAVLQALLDKVLRKFAETGPVALQGAADRQHALLPRSTRQCSASVLTADV